MSGCDGETAVAAVTDWNVCVSVPYQRVVAAVAAASAADGRYVGNGVLENKAAAAVAADDVVVAVGDVHSVQSLSFPHLYCEFDFDPVLWDTNSF